MDTLQSLNDRLSLLLRLTQAFSSTLDLDAVLNRVMDEVVTALHAERGFIVLVEPRTGIKPVPAGDEARTPPSPIPFPSTGEGDGQAQPMLTFRAARGLDHQAIQSPEYEISRNMIGQVVQQGIPILTHDAQADKSFDSFASVFALKLRSVLCVPLKSQDHAIGAIYIENRLQTGIFSQSDMDLLNAIASSATIAIENAQLHLVAVEKARMERELQLARTVQESLIPDEIPQISGWELAACWQPAREVAGDFYDFLPLPGGKLGLVIADVCDKGMASALIMAICRSILRASIGVSISLAEDIIRANRSLCADAHLNYFVTVFCGILDPATGELTYVNAGHNPPFFCAQRAGHGPAPTTTPTTTPTPGDTPAPTAANFSLRKLSATGMALGIDCENPYQQEIIQFEPGSFLLMYTDGLSDAVNPLGELFGTLRLQSLIQKCCHLDAQEMLQALYGEVGAYCSGTAMVDDITLMILRRL